MLLRLVLAISIVWFLGFGVASCVVHTHPAYATNKRALKVKKCPPSHYWDGEKCRHKGEGHGARKHDIRPAD